MSSSSCCKRHDGARRYGLMPGSLCLAVAVVPAATAVAPATCARKAGVAATAGPAAVTAAARARAAVRACVVAAAVCIAAASAAVAGATAGAVAPVAAAVTAGWRDELPRATALGDGELRWLGFRIYHATLWAEQRPFQPERGFALQLRYYRSISGPRLVQTSLDEITRLNGAAVDAATLARWNTALLRAFPDVTDGDELIGVYAPGHGMRLYNQRGLLADIADLRLARAFFGIWLDEQTRDQGLRRKLLGSAP